MAGRSRMIFGGKLSLSADNTLLLAEGRRELQRVVDEL